MASGVAKSAGVTAELRLGDLGGGHFRHSINTVYPFAFAAMSTVGMVAAIWLPEGAKQPVCVE